jgi:hypothetical protein
VRKFTVAATLAALGLALFAIPASASFDHHFSVFEKLSFKELPNGHAFRYRGKVSDPRNRDDRVGRDGGVCQFQGEVLRCKGTFHLNGEIGGFGGIKYRGDLRPGDWRLNVVGGSGGFEGVAGKIVINSLNRSGTKELNHFALVR